jgi:hypothetical protein
MLKPLWPHPAALLRTEKTRTLVIADLHLGWEIALSEKGIHVPSQTSKLLRRLQSLVAMFKPERLLILGDVKYTVATAEMSEWHDVPDFFSGLEKQVREISVIRGNHDGNLEPLLPESVKLLPATGVVMDDTGFFHGHKWPTPSLLQCKTLVMGHVHPVVAFRDPAGFRITRQVWVKADCNGRKLAETLLQRHGVKIEKNPGETLWKRYRVRPRTSQLFIMPSFNDFLGGRPLNERRFSEKGERIVGPVLRSDAVNLGDAETYLLDGTFLGTLDQLRFLS